MIMKLSVYFVYSQFFWNKTFKWCKSYKHSLTPLSNCRNIITIPPSSNPYSNPFDGCWKPIESFERYPKDTELKCNECNRTQNKLKGSHLSLTSCRLSFEKQEIASSKVKISKKKARKLDNDPTSCRSGAGKRDNDRLMRKTPHMIRHL